MLRGMASNRRRRPGRPRACARGRAGGAHRGPLRARSGQDAAAPALGLPRGILWPRWDAALLGLPRSLVMSFARPFRDRARPGPRDSRVTGPVHGGGRRRSPRFSWDAGTAGRPDRDPVGQPNRVAIASLMIAVSVTIGVSLMLQSSGGRSRTGSTSAARRHLHLGHGARRRAGRPVLAPRCRRGGGGTGGRGPGKLSEQVTVSSPLGTSSSRSPTPRGERSAPSTATPRGDDNASQLWKARAGRSSGGERALCFRHDIPPQAARSRCSRPWSADVPRGRRLLRLLTERGLVLMSRNGLRAHWDDRAISSLGSPVAPGHPVEQVADGLRSALAGTALQGPPRIARSAPRP